MKLLADHSLLFSPSDLITFLEGEFAAWMERAYAERIAGDQTLCPDKTDPDIELIRKKGMEHEARVLAQLEALHGAAVRIDGNDASARTLAAIQAGQQLIYQARLEHDNWFGYADFLLRTPTPSRLGAWSYEPLDSKLARSPKPYFLIQLCAYAEYLHAIQGVLPTALGVILGNGEQHDFATGRFFYFYRHLKGTFLAFQESFDRGAQPDPALEKSWGRWETEAERILEARDDLRLVARITRSQVKRFRAAGIATRTALAGSAGHIDKISDDVTARLRRQARVQLGSHGKPIPDYEVLPHPPETRIGLAMLPAASPGDVFFDLEGNPLVTDGLEYLFGAVTIENGAPDFTDHWAHNAEQEKAAFEKVVDWIHERRRQYPDMHVYHYANYEVAALCRLMGKYATREKAVDDLLRDDVFVDLYNVTRNGVAIGTEGYSLKDIEALFSPARTALVTDAASSVVEYNNWLASGEPQDWRDSPILRAIRDYNREDCESTWRLATWLRERQTEAGIPYVASPLSGTERGSGGEDERPEDELATRMLDGSPNEVMKLVAWLLGYHRREDKPMWWRFFDRLESPPEDLYDDPDCLANVRRTSTPPVRIKKSELVEFEFDPDQDTKLETGDHVYLLFGTEPQKEKIASIDLDSGTLTIKFGPSKDIPDFCHIIPNEYVPSKDLQEAVFRFADRWSNGQTDFWPAVEDLLRRRPPRVTRYPVAGSRELLPKQPTFPDDLISLIRSLDQTTLCIQGPPGAGKTFNAAAVIVALVQDGKRIGVSSNSHKAINNLLTEVARELRRKQTAFPIYKALGGDDDPEELDPRITPCKSKQLDELCIETGMVVGGSVWAFARPELDQRFDYLFIDEAGQVCLANAVAMGLAAKNIVLIGDQMQLSQPAQAVHPGKSGWSCLHYLLEGHPTIPPDLGVLLPMTWRLHPEICRFISDTAYEGRLAPNEITARRCLVLPPAASVLSRGTGIILDEISHEGNIQSSEGEAERIAEYVAELRRARVREDGKERDFDIAKDLLIVAPYNAQVRCIKERLADPKIRIASVDKFQGQEASVVIASMCASSLEESGRGPAFLLNPNRMNVALSRARCLAIVVASTKLVRTRPNSVEEMELFNLYCRLRYYAQGLKSRALQGA